MIKLLPARVEDRARAFTLIELLVSMAILTLMSTFLFAMLNSVTGISTHAQAQTEPHRNGRAILDLITRDLRSAVLPLDRTVPPGSPTLQPSATNTSDPTKISGPQLLIDPTTVVNGNKMTYFNAQCLFWQAPIATDAGVDGNLAEVGYFVRWDMSNAAQPQCYLCRYFVNPSVNNAANPNYLVYATPAPTAVPWVTSSLLDQIAPGNGTGTNNYAGWVADNVLSLWVRALDTTGTPITTTASGGRFNAADLYSFDSRKGYQDVNSTVAGGTSTLWMSALPATVEVAIVMLDPVAAKRLNANLSPAAINASKGTTLAQDPAKFWSDLALYQSNLPAGLQKSVSVYSTRIPLLNAK